MSSINIPLLETVSLLATLHCLVLSLVILFSKFFRSKTNNYLGFTLLIIAIVGINNWFWDIGSNPIIISLLDLFLWQFLYPTTLFVFFYKTSNNTSGITQRLKFFYLPFILLSALNIFLSLSTTFQLYNLPDIVLKYIPIFYKTISFFSIVFPVYMIILSYKYTLAKKNSLSKKWLKYLLGFLSLIILFGVVLESYRFIFLEKLPLTYLWTFSSIFIYWLTYKGMYQFKLSNDQFEIREITKREKKKPINSVNSKSSHFKKLVFLIEEDKIHHNPNLSRDSVAEQLEISNSYLSQIIKENTSVNFSDYINSHRIKDVKLMLKDSDFDKYSLLSIGLECGFNSKTSFYTNFKKETGLTPKEYKNK
ncbi:AraC-like DNA-binding protein [Lutibacter sp. Hel_I_33_5]|uniref:helix-turn-helix domain-containing protein n=1 Tax=Lutibacter sp. Hel_I_33_5 TaxID=1566289 RepID=UPI0011A7D677|nr:response regulator transcription factor [Lutibacter sp. Hel_I_33_5]TVZ54893.1 AraC-like DNA-binding protein [Lutibacter sp. Hel_I_33_5]